MAPPVSYLICGTPRTGSTLLNDALYPLGIAGRPREYFGLSPEHWLEQLKDFEGDYLTRVLSAGRTANGVFGAKVLYYQFNSLIGHCKAHLRDETTPPARLLRKLLPNLRYIWIRRNDHLAQAVSETIAVQSGVWQVRAEDSVKDAKPVNFNYDQVHGKIAQNKSYDREWQEYFEENAIDPFIIEYEEFVENYEKTMRQVLGFLQLPTDVPLRPPPLRKLANEISEEWIKKYKEDTELRRPEVAQLFKKAVELHQQGQIADAAKVYGSAIARDVLHFGSLHNLGLIRLQSGNTEIAVRLITRATRQDPDSAEAHNSLGLALKAANRLDEALLAWRKAIVLRPDHIDAHQNIGAALVALKRHDEAVSHFEKIVALRPSDSDAHARLGAVLGVSAQALLKRSHAHLQNALVLNPNNAEAHKNLRLLLQTTNRSENPARPQESALLSKPNAGQKSPPLAQG